MCQNAGKIGGAYRGTLGKLGTEIGEPSAAATEFAGVADSPFRRIPPSKSYYPDNYYYQNQETGSKLIKFHKKILA